MQISNYRSGGYTVVETDWIYTPVTGAPGTPAPGASSIVTGHNLAGQPAASAVAPRPAAPQMPYAICWGELKGLHQTAYFSAPFAAPVPNVSAWSASYKAVLRKQYNFAGGIHCPTMKSLAEAQQRLKQEEDLYRTHWMIVETGWKNQ